MKNRFAKRTQGEEGYVLILVLAVLAVGSLLIVPTLDYAASGLTSSRISKDLTIEYYSGDAAVEDAMWRLLYDIDSFRTLLADQGEGASTSYSLTINDMQASVLVEVPSPPGPEEPPPTEPGRHLHVSLDQEPGWGKPNVDQTFNYNIKMTNYGTSAVQIHEIMMLLPSGFEYEPGSSSGFATDDEPGVIFTITDPDGNSWEPGEQQLVSWDVSGLDINRIKIKSGKSGTLSFAAKIANPGNGVYKSQAWVRYKAVGQEEIVDATTGLTAPVEMGIYDITAEVGNETIRASVSVTGTAGELEVLSWQIE